MHERNAHNFPLDLASGDAIPMALTAAASNSAHILLSPHDKLKNASFLGAFLFIRLKKPMTIITKADKKVASGV